MDNKLDKHGRTIGWIKWINRNKFIGFLSNDRKFSDEKDENDVFFHMSEFKPEVNLDIGKCVQYRPILTPKGIQARDCILLDYIPPEDGEM